MFITVVVSVLLVNGLFAQAEEGSATSGRTFEQFEGSQWNPVNWFGSYEDRNQIKLDALYRVVNCLSIKEKHQCADLLKDARFKFEKWVNRPKPTKPVVEESANKTEKTTTASTTTAATTTSTEFPNV